MNGLSEEWGDEVLVIQVDIHDQKNRPLLARLDARFTPTFVLFDAAGREVWRQVGAIDPARARQEVAGL